MKEEIQRSWEEFTSARAKEKSKIDNAKLIMKLEKPKGKVDVVIDTDTYNEIDDQFAVAYLIKSDDKLNLKAIYAAPFHNEKSTGPADGMEKSYQEIMNILTLLEREDLKANVYEGTEKLPFFLKWKFFYIIFNSLFKKITKKLWFSP